MYSYLHSYLYLGLWKGKLIRLPRYIQEYYEFAICEDHPRSSPPHGVLSCCGSKRQQHSCIDRGPRALAHYFDFSSTPHTSHSCHQTSWSNPIVSIILCIYIHTYIHNSFIRRTDCIARYHTIRTITCSTIT